MTKQERKYLQADRDFLYQYALQFLTLERQISERKKRMAECNEEAARLNNEIRHLERSLRQLEHQFGNTLDQFTADYNAGILIESTIRLV